MPDLTPPMLELIDLSLASATSSRSTASRSRCPTARSWGSWGRTAPARRPRCASRSASWSPTRAGPMARATGRRGGAAPLRLHARGARPVSEDAGAGAARVPGAAPRALAPPDAYRRAARRSRSSASRSARTIGSRTCRSATSSVSSWPPRSSIGPTCWSWTSRSPASIRWGSTRSPASSRRGRGPRRPGRVLEPPARAGRAAVRRRRPDRPRADRRGRDRSKSCEPSREQRRLRCEVTGAPEDWYDVDPRGPARGGRGRTTVWCWSWTTVSTSSGCLDLARGAGDVTHFSRERASLAELFREAVQT